MPTLTNALRSEYQLLFDGCRILPEHEDEIDGSARKIMDSQARYRGVSDPIGVPWYVVGVLHSLEAGLDFTCHLHNGDPLSARTVHEPAGRIPGQDPPYTWEQSANDALALERYPQWTDWTVPGILFKWESFNGWGYRLYHPEVKSPYLWSFTNQYQRGKYVGDGTWSATAVSRQAGAAAILRRLAELGALAPQAVLSADLAAALATGEGALRYDPDVVTPGGAELQHYLNTLPGIFLREDGRLGPRTSAACLKVFGQYLRGDPRGA